MSRSTKKAQNRETDHSDDPELAYFELNVPLLETEKAKVHTRRVPTSFDYTNNGASHVILLGSWSNWKERVPMSRSTTGFHHMQLLEAGETYQYKYIVYYGNDERWMVDSAQKTIDDGHGNINNVVTVVSTPHLMSPTALIEQRKGHRFKAEQFANMPL